MGSSSHCLLNGRYSSLAALTKKPYTKRFASYNDGAGKRAARATSRALEAAKRRRAADEQMAAKPVIAPQPVNLEGLTVVQAAQLLGVSLSAACDYARAHGWRVVQGCWSSQ